MAQQLALAFGVIGRGGRRKGAGRKPLPAEQRHTPHRARPRHYAAHPVHVTLRARSHSLRSQYVVKTVLGALRDSNRASFRIAHYSVQHNHLHLIVEAESKAALSTGMRSLAVRLARRVNKLLFRRGTFWADRWHGQTLGSPRRVRHALLYVLQNHKKHAASARVPSLDTLSSAQWFTGFSVSIPLNFRSIGPPCIRDAQTWLLQKGWRRHGKIHPSESPAATPHVRRASTHRTRRAAPRRAARHSIFTPEKR